MIDLRNRHIEAVAETILETFYDVPLFLEGMRVLDVNFEREDTDDRLQLLAGDRHFHGDSLHRKCFEGVADLNVVEVHQRDTALEAILDLAGTVLEPLQSFDPAGMHH